MSLKPKRCKVCRGEFMPRQPMQPVCLEARCVAEHYARLGEKKKIAIRRKRERHQRQENNIRKEALKTAKDYMPAAQRAFNNYIRVRDYFKPCISCGKHRFEVEKDQGWKPGGAWDAGHYRTRGAASHLRFNTLNTHRQCKSCNLGSGKYGHNNAKAETTHQAYRENLIERIGLDRVEAIDSDNETRKFDIDYLKRVIRIFNRRTRHYKKIRGLA